MGRKKVITGLHIYLTDACNLNCGHCWIPRLNKNGSFRQGVIPLGYPLSDLFRFISICKAHGLKGVRITGGEPLLSDSFRELAIYLHKHNIGFGVDTNATLIDENICRLLTKIGRHVRCSISLDGGTADIHNDLRGDKHAFQNTVRGLKLLKKYKIPAHIVTMLHRNNYEHFDKLIALSKELSVQTIKVNRVSCLGRAKNFSKNPSLNEFLDLQNKLCSQQREKTTPHVLFALPNALLYRPDSAVRSTCCPSQMFGILPNGDISICGMGWVHDQLLFGNITDKSLTWNKIFETNNYRNFYRLFKKGPGGVCQKCRWLTRCWGYCWFRIYEENGAAKADPDCQEAYEADLFPKKYLIC